ncbi:Uncharacterised protein [Moraxella lacunata]|uniref:Uncharacterized protein n=1 Tax=Moraxella lacunata TaxID=477 RepID=A0A378TS50_MORLA|nr:hypothetical protein [Moraxella lacunata]STZ63689.1 Uncharacterised protein [Moraxella lacunata]
MTLIPKSIASDTVYFYKIQYKIMYFIGIIFISIFTLTALPMACNSSIIFFIFVIVMTAFHIMAFNYMKANILILADEVKEVENGLFIRNGKISKSIDYGNIQSVTYRYLFSIKNNVVELTFKNPTTLGNKVRFISWADTCNYNKEFTLNPYAKTPETQAWVDAVKEKIVQNTNKNPS